MTSRPGLGGSRSGCTRRVPGSRCRSTRSVCARSFTPPTTPVPRSCSRKRAPPERRRRLSWGDAGPAAADARADSYWHDGAVSVTWAMSQAPRGEVRENVLARLIAPHGDIARKRVTLLYRVIDPGEAARIVERDLHNAEFRVNSAARPTARAVVEQSAARATAQEEARGAALVNFGMLVTATVLDSEELHSARAAVDNLAPTARVNLRPVWGSQDSAFAAALPVGLFLPAHLKIPEQVRQAL